MRWLQLRFDFGSKAIRRAFDCFSKVIKVTVTSATSRSLPRWPIYSFRPQCSRPPVPRS